MDRNIKLIWLARLVMSAARSLAGVIVPIYLALLGFNGTRLGELFALVGIVSAIMSSLVGYLADKIGNKFALVVFPLLAAMAAIYYAFFSHILGLYIFAALGSFGRGAGAGGGMVGPYQPAESSFLIQGVPAKFRNDVFGRISLMSTLGALLGALLAVFAPGGHLKGTDLSAAFRLSMLLIAGLSICASLLALGIKEKVESAKVRKARAGGGFWPKRSMKLLVRFWATNSLNGIAVGMFGPFITYWFFKRFGAGPAKIGFLFAIVNLASLSSAISAAPLARRFGIVKASTFLRFAQSILLFPLALAPNFLVASVVYLIRMLAQRAALPLRQSFAVAMAHPDERARVAALSNVPSQVFSAASPSLSGWMFDNLSLSIPFEIGGLLQLLSGMLYYHFFKTTRPEEELEESG
ncbi:MAG: MFS transporter [Acidimicrobiaceae bacterium]|nr:MFS transporter [Acidimicrobiaceae bacterium]